MDPINYAVDVQSPFQAAAQGYQFGAAVRNDQQQQADRVRAQQAAQAAQQRQLMLQQELTDAAADHTKLPSLMVRYPDLAEKLKFGLEAGNKAAHERALSDAAPVYSALMSGRPDVAAQAARTQAQALRNSVKQGEADAVLRMADRMEADPQGTATFLAGHLSSIPGGDKIIEGVAKQRSEIRTENLAPAAVRTANAEATTKEATAAVAPVVAQAGADKAVADAKTAAVTARFAEPQAIIDLQKKGSDIEAIKSDMVYKKEANRIATMNAVVAREGNALKAEELRMKIREDQRKLDETIRTNAANAESGAASIDNMLNTVERLKKNKGLNDVIGSVEGAAYYPTQAAAAVNALNPLTSSGDDRADAIALIETLGSQTFMAQIPSMKGTGALSEKEGDKLQSSLQNLSRKQSEAQFRANLDEAARLMKLARENISKKTGVPLKPVDTPAAPGSRPPISSFYVPGQ